ncbi:hypothetical protein B0T22DRAFT_438733 [Podospora appendiculata]|uniref:Uncharacterized protein n=1 Tax=Podospora appendiculata TaxID=314037 RepID=A0AAE1CID1_9PEZI|nr:hypothetical protein B0T22DRAFT_438733 [Podospora appendiculata]
MHFSRIASLLLLPLLAVADSTAAAADPAEITTTATTYMTLTKTITLQRAGTHTATINGTITSLKPTISAPSSDLAPSTTLSFTPSNTISASIQSQTAGNAGSALSPAHVVAAAMAGVFVAALV